MKKILIISISLLFLSCATTPKEVVDLSEQLGQDVESIFDSYDLLVTHYYNVLRNERLDYLNNIWTPYFLNSWIEDGELINTAKGSVYWSESDESFVELKNADPQKTLQTINIWAVVAMEEIEAKRVELIEPIDKSEEALKTELQEQFRALIQANAAISAHLNSLIKVDEAQNSVLKSLELEDAKEILNSKLLEASVLADKGLEEIKRADGYIITAETILGGIK